MKILIPVAGKGTRLRPLTVSRPKALVEVAGKTIIEHIITRLIPLQPASFVFVRDPQQGALESFLEKAFSSSFEFVVQEEPLGLGDAVRLGLEKVEDQPVLVLLGDTIFEAPLENVVRLKKIAVGVEEVPDPERFGTVEIRDGKIVRLVEKAQVPPSNLAIVGIYWLPEAGELYEALSRLYCEGKRTKGELQLTDGLDELARKGVEMIPFSVQGWYDCGTLEALLDSQRALLEHRVEGEVVESVVIPPVFIGSGSRIERSVVGPYVHVGKNSIIRKSCLEDVILHESCELKESGLFCSVLGSFVSLSGFQGKIYLGDYSRKE